MKEITYAKYNEMLSLFQQVHCANSFFLFATLELAQIECSITWSSKAQARESLPYDFSKSHKGFLVRDSVERSNIDPYWLR